MRKAIIISGELAQDHEFIYPYYRLLEANFDVDVCLLEGRPVKGILGTTLPPNKNQSVKTIDQIRVEDYDILIIPGGVKAMEKVRQEKKIINFIKKFDEKKKLLLVFVVELNFLFLQKLLKEEKLRAIIVWRMIWLMQGRYIQTSRQLLMIILLQLLTTKIWDLG